jgi:hypothetical protein
MAGTNFARFTARQEADDVKVTVVSGETLADNTNCGRGRRDQDRKVIGK